MCAIQARTPLMVSGLESAPPNTEVQVREPDPESLRGRAKTKGCLGTPAADQFCAGPVLSSSGAGKASKALGLLMPGSLRIRAG